MACFLLREALRKPFRIRFIATCAHKKRNFPLLSPCVQSPHLGQPGFDRGCDLNPDTKVGLRPGKELALDGRSRIFPSFSFAYFLNPNLLSGTDRFGSVNKAVDVGSESDDPGMLWADSVKKKRKKKMNKHKFKKLSKRLRRKT